MKPNVRAVFGRRSEGEEEEREELRGGKGRDGGRDRESRPLCRDWLGRVVTSHKAPARRACEWLRWCALGGVREKGGDAMPRLRPPRWSRDSQAAEARANQRGGSRMAW